MSDLHERAVRMNREIVEDHGGDRAPITARYTLRVLEVFVPMRAALEAAVKNCHSRGCICADCEDVQAALQAARGVTAP